jgi:adhesin transport system outer membrane protein
VFENAEVLALDAINAFLEVRRQRELVRLSEENLQAHEDMLANLREREASDAGSSVDVVQTEARRSLARATLFRVQNQLRDSEANYKRIVGEHPTDLDEPTVDVSALPQDWEDALTLAKESNPTTKIFEAEINIAKKDVEIADSNMYPKINLEAEYSKLQDADGDEEEIDSAMLMVRMRWNLYRGGSDQAEKRAALARVMQAKNSRYDAANGAVEEMRISWNSYEITAERVKVLGEAVEFNQETLNNYKELFNVGQRSLLDVLDAENELFVSRSLLVTANSNHMSASYRMLAAGGQLLDTLNIEPPKQGNPETPTFTQQVFSD